ncbi:MAG: hypothetical protein WCO09_03195 [bacterium]
MKKFIAKNWFKLGILLFLIAIILFGVYFFAVFKPREDAQIIINQNVTRCNELGIKRYKDESTATTLGYVAYTDHQYAYNAKLGECLYKGGYRDLINVKNYVIDLFTNEEVLSFTASTDSSRWPSDYNIQSAKFDTESSELFKN